MTELHCYFCIQFLYKGKVSKSGWLERLQCFDMFLREKFSTNGTRYYLSLRKTS